MSKNPEQTDLKHYLIIRNLNEDVGQDDYYEELEWKIEHDPICPKDDDWGGLMSYHTCAVGNEVMNVGLDGLEPEWDTLEPGKYEIRAWHEVVTSYGGTEYEGGLEIVD
jgi:hypothetical protein